MTQRRDDVDWLRVFATFLLFPFHVAKVFDVPPYYHLKNAQLSDGLGTFTGIVHQFHMPLFFLLAGWSVSGSLRARATGGFLRERVSRLFVPFLFGCIVICPPIRWIEVSRWPGQPHQTFLDFLPRFFGEPGMFTWSHLWFLIYLFTFSCLYIPLLAWLQRPALRVEHVRRSMVYLAIVPFVLVQIALRGRWPGMQNLYDDWGNFAYYSLFFLGGYLLGRFPAVEAAVHGESRRLGWLGVAGVILLGATAEHGGYPTPQLTPRYVAFWTGTALAGVGLVAGLLGFAARRLRFSTATLRYGTESAFPVYILHQPVIVFLAAWVIGFDWGIAPKFCLLLATTPVVTLVLYQGVVRPWRPLRFFFGMKPPRPVVGVSAPLAA